MQSPRHALMLGPFHDWSRSGPHDAHEPYWPLPMPRALDPERVEVQNPDVQRFRDLAKGAAA